MKLGVSSRSEIIELVAEPPLDALVSRSSDARLHASVAHLVRGWG